MNVAVPPHSFALSRTRSRVSSTDPLPRPKHHQKTHAWKQSDMLTTKRLLGDRSCSGASSSKKKRRKRNRGKDRGDEIKFEREPLREIPALWNYGSSLYEEVYKSRGPVPPSLADEFRRRDIIAQLRQKLLKLCGKGKAAARYPSLAFERWLIASSVLQHPRGDPGPVVSDPLIPTHGVAEPGLVADLVKVGYDQGRAKDIAQTLANHALKTVRSHWGSASCSESAQSNFCDETGMYQLLCTDIMGKPYRVDIHPLMYNKFKKLYHPRNEAKDEKSNEAAFNLSVLKCCLRYETLSGPGFQVSITHDIFRSLGECIELFASPFNCVGLTYGSAFADTDACFGSLGSAFDWFNKKVSKNFRLEANPPFVPQILEAFVDMLVSNVAKDGQLSVIIPVWTDAPFYSKLLALENDLPKKRKTLTDKWIQPSSTSLVHRKIPTSCELFTI